MQRTLDTWTARHPGTGALVWRVTPEGATVIASHRAERPYLPASTMKIATGAGALLALGPDHRFTTRLLMAPGAVRQGSVLRGTFYLQGGGDPVLSTRGYARRYLGGRGGGVADLVAPLRRRGVRAVRGPLVADEGVFDSRRTGLQWRSHYAAYSPPLSGLAINQNHVGDVRRRYVADPPRAAAQRFRTLMGRNGVRHTGAARTGRTPADALTIGTVSSPPLGEILRLMNPSSDNFVAEMLRKDVGAFAGAGGTTAEGNRVTTLLLSDRGMLAPGDRLVDGSGLSRANRLSAATLVRILAAAEREPEWGRALVRSLPRGGEGTLVRRFRAAGLRTRVRGKTGYINGVSSLAGVAVSPSGERYVFAFLMNDWDIAGARQTQDAVITQLARGRADTVVGTPVPPVVPGGAPVVPASHTSRTPAVRAPALF
ncbi:MAG TPA: D-alanyl-D-alanine carboxypeptidase/D-alanyl-D-alanine-endopeptidase [Miltoncostaeaceae bacterium]|nr:D-alanyl-D-alanine carboxypeptidase/D-alanyl-D-alanine-endopeptidase [Miltoncostaeaceae bacterium]